MSFDEQYHKSTQALNHLFKSGKLVEARDLAYRLLQRHSSDFDILIIAAASSFHLHINDEAADAFERALAIKPDDANTLYNLGQVQVKRGKFAEGIALYKKSIGLGKRGPDRLLALCNALISDGRSGEALDYAQQALQADPNDAKAIAACARAHYGAGHYDLAENLYRHLGVIGKNKDKQTGLVGLMFTLEKARRGDPETRRTVFQDVHPARSPLLDIHVSRAMPVTQWLSGQPDARSMIVDTPQSVDIEDRDQSTRPLRYLTTQNIAAVVPNGAAYCGWDFVVAPHDIVLDGTGYRQLWAQKKITDPLVHLHDDLGGLVAHEWSGEHVVLEEDAFFLSAPNDLHFGHWLLDFLPRLRGLKLFEFPSLKVFIPETLPMHGRQTLAKFGVRPEDLIEGKVGTKYSFRNLVFFQPGSCYLPNLENVKFLYKYLPPQIPGPARHDKSRRVFLVRVGTRGGRNISNAGEVEALLKLYSFTFIRRPELSLDEQDEIIFNAGIVVSTFGTDMVSVYQMRPGAHLVALHFRDTAPAGQDDIVMQVSATCPTIGVNLHRIECESVIDYSRSPLEYDLFVDVNALRSCLDLIIQGQEPPHLNVRQRDIGLQR